MFVGRRFFVAVDTIDEAGCLRAPLGYIGDGAGGRGGPTDEPRQGRNAATVVCSTLPRSSGVLLPALPLNLA